ncbi:phage prohead protease, HK97 family [Sinosporangium album]|uniref:Phage prohead protease, HK97 family n=1 Tax=Sinosporangium album TaxID=504805 RepID=A0A1G8ECJ9_9ACTN|nr:2'-5' RNA ligase family protein [Sinosporangium album]SDH67470.1 phage prohead protease, HK97 family [Sinosporangium album]
MGTLQLERKAAGSAAAGTVTTADEGTVEALVSVTNVIDNVGDLIVPGAYAETLAVRTPKGLFSHDEKVWVARTEHIEELMPGDPRLLAMTAHIKDWPVDAGGLYVKARFNLETTAGREAFSNVKFFGREQEWSIGYKVPKGGATRDPRGVRRIKRLHLFEYSPVLFGANSRTFTLSVKSNPLSGGPVFAAGGTVDLPGSIAECIRAGSPAESKRELIRAARESGALGVLPAEWLEGMDAKSALEDLATARTGSDQDECSADAGVDADSQTGASPHVETKADTGTDSDGDSGPGTMVAFMLPPDLASQLAIPDGLPAEQLHVTLGYLGKGLDDTALAAAAEAVQRAAATTGPLAGRIGGIGAFPPGEDGMPVFATVDVPGLEVLRQHVVDNLAEAGVPARAEHGYTPHVTLTYRQPDQVALPDPLPAHPVEFTELALVRGNQHVATFPLTAGEELEDDGWDDLLRDTDAHESEDADNDDAKDAEENPEAKAGQWPHAGDHTAAARQWTRFGAVFTIAPAETKSRGSRDYGYIRRGGFQQNRGWFSPTSSGSAGSGSGGAGTTPGPRRAAGEENAPSDEPGNPQPGDGPRRYHTTLDGLEHLEEGLRSGIAAEHPIIQGAASRTRLVEFGNGVKAVEKYINDDPYVSPEHQADAEMLGSLVGRAVGAQVPGVLRAGDRLLYLEYLDWPNAYTVPMNERARYADTDSGRLLGLLDLVIDNYDRNPGNWLVLDDGSVAGIDHGAAWEQPFERSPDGTIKIPEVVNDFMKHFVHKARQVWLPNDMAPEDIDIIWDRLTSLREQFHHLGRGSWFTDMLERLEAVKDEAAGTQRRLRS